MVAVVVVALSVLLLAGVVLWPRPTISPGSSTGGSPVAFSNPESRSGNPVGSETPSPSDFYWNELVTPAAPSARAGAAMAYDPAEGYTLLFGGCPAGGGDYSVHNCTGLGDTWVLESGVWMNLTGSLKGPSPPPRVDAGIAYDATDGSVVLFGGYDGTVLYNDTWTFASGAWSEAHPPLAPSARFSPGMAEYSPDRGVILFGGTIWGTQLGDTWTFQGGVWTHLRPTTAPAPRFSMALSYDPVAQTDLLFAGWNASFGSFDDTWNFANGTWTEDYPSSNPPPQNYPSLVYDSLAGTFVLYGGHAGYAVWPETWGYNRTGWFTFPATSQTPAGRWGTGLSYDPATQSVWLYGGFSEYGGIPSKVLVYYNDTWEFSVGRYSVTFQESGLPPGTRWSVTFGGVTEDSTNASMQFEVPNGTYSFQVLNISGYSDVPTNGRVPVAGVETYLGVLFSASSPSNSTSSSSSGSTGFLEGLGTGAAITATAAVALFTVRRRPRTPLSLGRQG